VTVVLGSPLMRVNMNLYKMTSWLVLIRANAVSTIPMKARTSCLFQLNSGTNFKPSPTLMKSQFILQVLLLTELREFKLRKFIGRFDVTELLLLLAYTSNPWSVLSGTRNWRCRVSVERWTGGVGSLSNPELVVSAFSRNPDCVSSGAGLPCSPPLGARSSRLNLASDTK